MCYIAYAASKYAALKYVASKYASTEIHTMQSQKPTLCMLVLENGFHRQNKQMEIGSIQQKDFLQRCRDAILREGNKRGA